MSKSTTDNEELFNKAAYILHGSANPPTTSAAMKQAGFDDKDCKNPSMQKKVRRLYMKMKTPSPTLARATSTLSPQNTSPPTESALQSSTSNPTLHQNVQNIHHKKLSDAKMRLSMKQKHAILATKQINKRKKDEAFIAATIQWKMELNERKKAQETNASREAKSMKSICKEINKKHGTDISEITVRKYVQEGKVGVVMGSQGCKGNIEPSYFKALCTAVETFVSLTQLEAKNELSCPKLARTVNAVINNRPDENRKGIDLLNRIRSTVSISFQVGKFSQEIIYGFYIIIFN